MAGLLERWNERCIAAVCEGLFPANDAGIPDWRDTEMVARMEDYLRALPPPQRRLIRTLFVLVELGTPLLTLRFRRMSRLTPLQRAEVVRHWRRSAWAPLRLLGDALKATTTVIYLSHPQALKHLGVYKTCDRPDGRLHLPLIADALRRTGTTQREP